jgi:hypothetical protein
MWTLINLLLTLDKRSIVKQGTLRFWLYLLYHYNWPLAKFLVQILKSVSIYYKVHFYWYEFCHIYGRCHLCKESNIQEDLQHLFFKCIISNRFISNITIFVSKIFSSDFKVCFHILQSTFLLIWILSYLTLFLAFQIDHLGES